MKTAKIVRIQSQGNGFNTVITDDQDRQIQGVKSATIWLEGNDINRVSLDIMGQDIEVYALASDVTLTCPLCGEGESHECGPK